MRVGVVREIKTDENRVALTPAGVMALVQRGHTVLVEQGAGEGSGFSDQSYAEAGGRLLREAGAVWAESELIVKVKEPLAPEIAFFRPGLVLFTYLHLAAEPILTRSLLERHVVGIAYETVQDPGGGLPLLTPMSEVAGRMATQVGAQFLEKPYGGRGILLGGVPGVLPAQVVILGGGVVGQNAARVALGMGAQVTVLDIAPAKLRQIDDLFRGQVLTLMSSPYHIAEAVRRADLLIGAVLVPGAKAPRLVTEEMVGAMKAGSVIVDVAIDQGGSIQTIDRITTHRDPVYLRHGVVHYAVANMPGAVPRTSTLALTNATLPYLLRLADLGWAGAVQADPLLAPGVNTARGALTCRAVAEAHAVPYTPLEKVL